METEREIVTRLERVYVPIFQQASGPFGFGMSDSDAKAAFQDLIKKAREASQRDGFKGINSGKMLDLAEQYPKARADLEWKKAEGVREEDFRWWWDMHDLERQVILQMDDALIANHYVAHRKSGMSKEESALWVKKTFPRYVVLMTAIKEALDTDSALPIELKNRVTSWMLLSTTDLEESYQLKLRVTSMNALVRQEIRRGNI
jgi:hypothetical protein